MIAIQDMEQDSVLGYLKLLTLATGSSEAPYVPAKLMGSLGTSYSPNSNTSAGLDVWYIRIKDRIGVPDLSLLTAAEAKGDNRYENYGIKVERDPKGRRIKITSPASNLAKQELAGIDLSASSKIGNKKRVQAGWNFDSSYQVYNREAAYQGQSMQDRVGEADRPQWRVNNTAFLAGFTDHWLSLSGRTTGSTKKVNPDLGRMPIYTEYDMHYRLEGLFKGAMAFGVTNLTNAKPPKDDSNNPNLNYDIYSYLGRTYYTSLSQAY